MCPIFGSSVHNFGNKKFLIGIYSKMSESINFKLVPSELWKLPNVYQIEEIESHQDYDLTLFLNDLAMITISKKSPLKSDSFNIEYGILAPSSFTPKSKVSHIVTHLRVTRFS